MKVGYVTEYKANQALQTVRAFPNGVVHVWMENMWAVSFEQATAEEMKQPLEWWLAHARAALVLEA